MNTFQIAKVDECTLRSLTIALEYHERKCWMCAEKRYPCPDARLIKKQIHTLERLLKEANNARP